MAAGVSGYVTPAGCVPALAAVAKKIAPSAAPQRIPPAYHARCYTSFMRAWIWLLVGASCGPPSSPVGKTLSYFEEETLRIGTGCGEGIAVDSERYVWRSGYCISAAPPSTHYVGRV